MRTSEFHEPWCSIPPDTLAGKYLQFGLASLGDAFVRVRDVPVALAAALAAGLLAGIATEKNISLTVPILPAIELVAFYSLVSFNYARYGQPVYPIAIAVGIVVLAQTRGWWRERRAARRASMVP
ncbi:MAG: hypothetical protein ABIT36_09310 [Steroidobacteraceae bacterium]